MEVGSGASGPVPALKVTAYDSEFGSRHDNGTCSSQAATAFHESIARADAGRARDVVAPGAGGSEAYASEQGLSSQERQDLEEVLQRLWELYETVVYPIEEQSCFHQLSEAPMTKEEFEARPQVLFLGRECVGKTSMIRWLTGAHCCRAFDVAPQASTDRFMAVVYGKEEKLIRGYAATRLPQLPFKGLDKLETGFLSNFCVQVLPSEILREVTLIDSPGILAGQSHGRGVRGYDFAGASAWLAERASLIVVCFDAVNSSSISDELQQVLEALKPHANKVRYLLNKADSIRTNDLHRVTLSFGWNVGKIMRTPEVPRLYTSSFWEEPFQDTVSLHRELFEDHKRLVCADLWDLPKSAAQNRVDELVSRIKRVQAHLMLMWDIRDDLPYFSSHAPCSRYRQDLCDRLIVSDSGSIQLNETPCGFAGAVPPAREQDRARLDQLRVRLATFENLKQLPARDISQIQKLNGALQQVTKLMEKLPLGGVLRPDVDCRPVRPPPVQRGGICRKRKRAE